MASNENIIQAMNNITLEEEEEDNLALDLSASNEGEQILNSFNTKLCVVARFLSEGYVDFSAMQQTMAALWKPGMGVYMKELEANLFLFQFYHEVDVKRVMEGCPWSFNRRALIMQRMHEGEIPRNIELKWMDLWIQVYDLKPGFMTERILTEVGNYTGKFVSSCPSNFSGVWRDYFRIRVTIDVSKPLKRRMKVKRAAENWFWINFKYENVPTFCFICGVLGHSEKFCSRLFTVAEADIVKPYGPWMRAPFRKQVKPIGAKWLRYGTEGDAQNFPGTQSQAQGGGSSSNSGSKSCYQDPLFSPHNQRTGGMGSNQGDNVFKQNQNSGKAELRDANKSSAKIMEQTDKEAVTVIESKKRRTSNEMGLDIHMGSDNENTLDSNEDVNMSTEQVSPINTTLSKNGSLASAQGGARLAL